MDIWHMHAHMQYPPKHALSQSSAQEQYAIAHTNVGYLASSTLAWQVKGIDPGITGKAYAFRMASWLVTVMLDNKLGTCCLCCAVFKV